MSDETAITALEVRLENLTASISALTQSVEKNNEKLERLAILEVSHNNSNSAIARAFGEITSLEKHFNERLEMNDEAHQGYNKWIWLAVGFCSAISIVWTVVGYRMNAMIDEQIKSSAEMRMHIHDDEIKKPADVLRAIGKGASDGS